MTNQHNGTEKVYLFPMKLLHDIDFESDHVAQFKPFISPKNPGENLLMRPLALDDYDKGYMDLLRNLTITGDVTREMYEARFMRMKAAEGSHYIAVLEDTLTGLVIGSATLAIEQKFIHLTRLRGRIEDVVVNNNYRGRQLGKLLVETMTLLSKSLDVYKISLDCLEDKVTFYEMFGYKHAKYENFMVQRFNDVGRVEIQ